MNRSSFLEILNISLPVKDTRKESNILKRIPECHKWLLKETNFLDDSFTFRERLEVIYSEIYAPATCQICNINVHLDKTTKTWRKTCSQKCRISAMKFILKYEDVQLLDKEELNKEKLIEFLDKNYPKLDSRCERYISRKSTMWHKWIVNNTNFLLGDFTFRDRLAAACLGINTHPKCGCCENLIYSFNCIKWKEYCSSECAIIYGRKVLKEDYYTSTKWREEQGVCVREGIMAKYGTCNMYSIPEKLKGILETNNNRYGVDYHMQTKEGAIKISDSIKAFFQTDNGMEERKSRGERLYAEFDRAFIEGDVPYFYKNGGGVSKEELQVKKIVEDILGYEINSTWIKTKKGANRQIDLYIPEFKFGIEYNGVFDHSEERGKYKEYHLEKLEAAEEAGIHLMTIWNDDWSNIRKKHIIITRIKVLLGKCLKKSHARKCELKEIDITQYNNFLNDNHIQGSNDSASVRLCLVDDKKVVAVMGFKKCTYNITKYGDHKGVWELCRYSSTDIIVGGFSKLLSFFRKTFSPILVYSFAERYLVNKKENVYTKNGFFVHSVSPPDYSYLYKNKRTNKFHFQKENFIKFGLEISNKTEDELRKEMQILKIWDCGKICYAIS